MEQYVAPAMTETDKALEQAIQGLPKEITPTSDLWSRIEPRLGAQMSASTAILSNSPSRKRWGWGIAAAISAIWFAGILISERDPDSGYEAEFTQVADESAFAEQILLQTYEQQKALQLATVTAIPVSNGNWQQQLSIRDDTIAQLNLALNFYPDDPRLLRQLNQLYRQQLTYLQRLNAVAERTEDHNYL